MQFSNTHLGLGDPFYQSILPEPVPTPRLLLWNGALAEQLGMADELARDPARLAQVFSGNALLEGSEPVALAYAGHQFGHFVPQLGDGRAHLLGEVIDRAGQRRDIQLKGSGQTAFSRNGDGRCALGPAVREYIMSEALHWLGVPTTRTLAVVTTGEPVFRERPLPGAVLTRVAASHLRVGSFEYFAARRDRDSLRRLCDYAIDRHYPHLHEADGNPYLGLVEAVVARQVRLVVEWLRIGFIHGVMNTDNTAISGETIDFGPCAMLGRYDPATVYSSIDRQGRYAFGNQPSIAQWNMARFAEALLPLVDEDPERAVAAVTPLIDAFRPQFQQAYAQMLGDKLGLDGSEADDAALIEAWLALMEEKGLDYTLAFDELTRSLGDEGLEHSLSHRLGDWYPRWRERLGRLPADLTAVREAMRRHNPVVIPRNHQVEAVIDACEQGDGAEAVESLLEVLRSPYREIPATARYQSPPSDGDCNYQTFCGT
jgi:uncharacterized protein YdiU (UPF0061 family)